MNVPSPSQTLQWHIVQELSPHTRTMVVGPASVAAIKDGQNMKYDNEFVIAEVNADMKYYCETKGGKFVCADSDTTYVSCSDDDHSFRSIIRE